jgi:hypothetical protein
LGDLTTAVGDSQNFDIEWFYENLRGNRRDDGIFDIEGKPVNDSQNYLLFFLPQN